jgi:hypothetical protein
MQALHFAFNMQFERWADAANYIAQQTGRRPFPSKGIIPYTNGNILLRSVEPTPYYADDLTQLDRVLYTAEGRVGNQSLRTCGNLAIQEKGRRIFLLEVTTEGRHTRWIWHGEYEFRGEIEEMQHPDMHNAMRTIYRFVLHKV